MKCSQISTSDINNMIERLRPCVTPTVKNDGTRAGTGQSVELIAKEEHKFTVK